MCVSGVMYVCARGLVSVCQGSCMCVLGVMYMCARGIEFTTLSTIILLLYFGTVPTVRYFSGFFFILYKFQPLIKVPVPIRESEWSCIWVAGGYILPLFLSFFFLFFSLR